LSIPELSDVSDTLSIPELSDVSSDWEWNADNAVCDTAKFVDNVLIYISGFLLRTILKKEKCMFCYTYLKESKNRITCPLINIKQLGGLVVPVQDIVSIVKLANRNVKLLSFILFLT